MYVYLNLNPHGKKTGDCVIRATALGLGVDWYQASDMLYEQARNCGCEMSCLGCYSKLFARLGFVKNDVSHEEFTVQDIASKHPNDIVIIRTRGHLTCSIDGKIHDIWNCADEIAYCYWVVENCNFFERNTK